MGAAHINFSIVNFAIYLAAGIAIGHWGVQLCSFTVSVSLLLLALFVLIILLFIVWRWKKKHLEPSSFFGILVFSLFFLIGFFNYTLRLPPAIPNHYTNTTFQENTLFQLKISEALKPDLFNTKYIAEVIAMNERKSVGKVLLLLQKDSTSQTLYVDDLIVVSKEFQPVRAPKNPNQFDYAAYMKTLGVYGQLQIKHRDILIAEKGRTTLTGFSENIRNQLIDKLKSTSLQENERSILQALVLGQRRDIDKDLYKDYAAAGAIHILAVSGLHVGILYFILLFLFSPFTYFKYGSLTRSIVIVVLLWCFAVLAGLSPSVVRAVTMFSFFTFATAIKRPTNSINTLFLSFFLLLLLRPNWLFHVGFQLSYLAVFAILWIQPKLYKMYQPKFYIDKLFWGIITVTIAAQLGILPLSLYYFHQFPGLFFLTNIVILPILGVLLASGLLLVLLAAFNWLPDVFVKGYNVCLTLLNSFISWVARQETFLFQDIPFSKELVVGSYLLLAGTVLLWKQFCYKRALFFLTSVVVLIGILLWEKRQAATTEMVVFHINRKSLIGIKEHRQLTVFKSDTVFSETSSSYPIQAYKTAAKIKSYSEQSLPKYFRFKKESILVLDSIGVYPEGVAVSILVLIQSPKVNLERLIDSLRPHQIIADGSNYRSYVKRWRETCKKKKLPFHHTGTKGAFTLK
jgi:competence protein ComEC